MYSTLKVVWEKICRPKWEGGLGVRKTEDVDTAFLAKQGWKILKQPDNVWVQLMNQKYLK